MNKSLLLIPAFILLIIIGISITSLVEDVPADKICANQVPFTGTLKFYYDPGAFWQWFGTTTYYDKSTQVWFSAKSNMGQEDVDESIPIIFNDGGNARISGSIRVDLPRSYKMLRELHTKYGSMEAVVNELIIPTMTKVVFTSGPLMNSYESYAARKTDLIRYIEDQAQNGVYDTESREKAVIDEISQKQKIITVAELVPNLKSPGGYLRQEQSPLTMFGIKVHSLAIDDIIYDNTIMAQIKNQQKAKMQVETAIAEAKEAQQEAIKAEEQGKAQAAKAKWDQEVIKAKFVTEAEQKRDIAKLDKEAAEFNKQKLILEGQGESEKKRLIMQADGALTQKINAYVEVNKYYADAIKNYAGNWVPTTYLGAGDGKSAPNAAQEWLQMMTIMTAKQLDLEPNVYKK